nr:Ig-like domain-containing protein [Xenococcaceae cyanobacterium MO_167.B52]
PNYNNGTALDTDGDGQADFQDLDSDNDGILDVTEAGGSDPDGDGILGNGVPTDSDNNGLADTVDPNNNGTPLSVPDTDRDGQANFQDLDSDGDGISDLSESGNPTAVDANNDGVVDGQDNDGDGIIDAIDGNDSEFGSNTTPVAAPQNTDNTDQPDYLDPDSDNDGIFDISISGNAALDRNGDGIIDNLADSDGDGLADEIDNNARFGSPLAPDTDGDGIPNALDLDDDNDGILDTDEGNQDTDGDGIPNAFDLDSDNDGITDLQESGLSPSLIAALDTNNDGVIDSDNEFGNNGLADGVETTRDSGTPNYNNGTALDTDGDGQADFQDLDSDNDGRNDVEEAGLTDTDGDGRVDGSDPDSDGLLSSVDNSNSFGGSSQSGVPDTDRDGVPDFQDSELTQDSRATTPKDTPLFLNPLVNSIDPDENPIVITDFTNGNNGTVTIDSEGGFLIYTPNPGFIGQDSINYTFRDANGNLTSTTIAVNVSEPSRANNDSSGTAPDSEVAIDVLSNDGNDLILVGVSNGENGTVTIDDNGTPNDPSDDRVVYIPNPAFVGEDSFTYTVEDEEGNEQTATVTVLVDPNRPNAADDQGVTEPGRSVQINVLKNDTDPKDEILTIISVTQPVRGQAVIDDNGTPDDPTDDQIVYTSDESEENSILQTVGNGGIFSITGGDNQNYTDNFSYTVEDEEGNRETATVNVTNQSEVRIKFSLTDNQANFVNELGVYVVDDELGTINGIAPGQEGYMEAALNSGKVIFTSLSQTNNLFGDNPTRIIGGFRPTDNLGFFLVQNDTVDNVLDDLEAGRSPAEVFFATTAANDDNFEHLTASSIAAGQFELNWEDQSGGGDRDFNDLRLMAEITTELTPLGSDSQGGAYQEILDLTSAAERSVEVTASILESSSFNNTIGFYRIANNSGDIRDPLTGQLITADDSNYAEAALAQRVIVLGENDSGSTTIEGGDLLAPFLIADGTVEDALADAAPIYFAYLGANSDGVDHVRLLADNTFGFEDIAGGGDRDFDDVVVHLDLT